MADGLTPYDRGERAEPEIWPIVNVATIAEAAPNSGARFHEEVWADRFGKVDFDDDASETLATVWMEKRGDRWVLVIEGCTDIFDIEHVGC